ncbi:MAG: spore protease YyaC [Lachnospiraceae bacterium]|nr:spore protease YyaC [Lachnospiraceae bacterium]
MNTNLSEETYYINATKENASLFLGSYLSALFQERSDKNHLPPVFLCIGSDRVAGDSLGPIIGSRLCALLPDQFFVYGTLEHPVHALNLSETLRSIYRDHSDRLLIAIDASLGTKKHQGYVTVSHGSLSPGAGVNKTLEAAGDISITGIVNINSRFSQLTLQSTRLSIVMALAECIAKGICLACQNLFSGQRSSTAFFPSASASQNGSHHFINSAV